MYQSDPRDTCARTIERSRCDLNVREFSDPTMWFAMHLTDSYAHGSIFNGSQTRQQREGGRGKETAVRVGRKSEEETGR